MLTFHVATARQEVIRQTDAVLIGLACAPDGSNIASASWRTGPAGECEILLWNPVNRQSSGSLIGAPLAGLGVPITSDPLSIAISPDSRWLAAGTKVVDADGLIGAHIGGEVCVWELATKTLKWSDRTTHTDTVQSVFFSSDGKRLASAGIDKLIRIWDVETGRLKATLVGAAWHGITSVAFSPDESLLASGGDFRRGGHEIASRFACRILKGVDPLDLHGQAISRLEAMATVFAGDLEPFFLGSERRATSAR